MAGKFVIFITALAMANAVPIWVIGKLKQIFFLL